MSAPDRTQSVAISFATQYYTTLVERTTDLPNFYSATATAKYDGRVAKGASAVSDLLKQLLPPLSVKAVQLKTVGVTRTAKGSMIVNITGTLTTGEDQQRGFTQDFELREQTKNTFAITADTLQLPTSRGTAVPTMNWAMETPPMFARVADAEAVEEIAQPAPTSMAAPITPPAVAVEEKKENQAGPAEQQQMAESVQTTTPLPEASAPAVPTSFAEALKLKKATGVTAAAVVRVSDKQPEPKREKSEPKKEKSEPKKEKSEPKKGEGVPKRPVGEESAAKRGARPATKMIFYDIIIKNLPTSSTEETVRALVPAVVSVKLVKVETHASKKDPKDMRTFAFVQIDKEAARLAGLDTKAAIAKVIASGNEGKKDGGVQFDEVRERKFVKQK